MAAISPANSRHPFLGSASDADSPGRRSQGQPRTNVLLLGVGGHAQNQVGTYRGEGSLHMQSLRGGLRPRVLLVDDDEESRHLLTELLEAEEVAVVGEAGNGVDALER